MATWRKENLDRSRETTRAWRIENQEKVRQASWRNYHRHSAARRASRRKYYHENREAERERYHEWRIKNAARNAYKSMMYEARKKRAMPAWADKQKILEVYKRCAEINETSAIKYQVDHIYPLCSPIMCGLHVHQNLRIIPAVENQRKSNRIIEIDASFHLR